MRAFIVILVLFVACEQHAPVAETQESTASTSALTAAAKNYMRLDLPNLDDNVKNDTLLIYTTHALGDGTFLMAARSQEETREGLRLFLYKPKPDSSADVIAYSKPGFESWTMLPTYFSTGDPVDGIVIIANMGEKQSWGQEAFWLIDQHFISLGWLDVAVRSWKTEDDSTYQWRTSIADRVNVRGENGSFEFTFSGDSLQLYDDLQGHQEVMLPAGSVSYRCIGNKTTLVINDKLVEPKDPI